MRLASLLQRSLAGCAIAASLAVSAPASATPLINTGWLAGATGESYTIHWSGGTPAVNPAATGGFTGTFGGTPIVYWCFDLLHTFSIGSNLDYTATQIIGALPTQLSTLFNVASANGGYSDLDHSAAFQLAIWNLEYDGDTSLSSGSFYVTGGANAINIANAWLALLTNPLYANPANTVTELDSTSHPQHQNFITFSNVPSQCCRVVPEPPMLPLVITVAGLAALVQTRRRMRVGGE
jgi:hypothetical protein